mgnify:CR=1 FL=1
MQNCHSFFILLAKVLSHDGFIDSLNLDQILSYSFWGVFLNETFCDIILNGMLRFFVEHEDEELVLLVVFLVLLNVVELGHEFVFLFFILAHAFGVFRDLILC